MFERFKRLWKLSEPPKPRQFTWNGEKVSKELFEERIGFETTDTPNSPAKFLPRVKQKPIEQVLKALE